MVAGDTAGPLGDTEDVADIWGDSLASDHAEYMTGQAVNISGGQTNALTTITYDSQTGAAMLILE